MNAEAAPVPEVLIERHGSLGRIRLNRPKALNSLTHGMVRTIADALDGFEVAPDIGAVLITGEGGRAFCAGGDIRDIYDAGPGRAKHERFFRDEYPLNVRIGRYPKPYVALMDGIVMGGGAGVSVHGSHRVVTERTRFAMPEAGIGFFPDVGTSWLLSRGAGEVGTYLGLVGARVGAADAILAGVADSLVPSSRLADLVGDLAALPSGATRADVSRVVERLAAPIDPAPLARQVIEIDRAFAFDTVEAIMAALEAEQSDFARETRDALLAKSPTSLKLTLRLFRLGRASLDPSECVEREFSACLHLLDGGDFFEGVRAAIIDKDRAPRWSPATLDEVDDLAIDRCLRAVSPPLFDRPTLERMDRA